MSLPERTEPDRAFRSESWVGRTIDDRYKVVSLLGEGGMGAVFLAEHVKLAKKVALKVILPQFAGDGEVAERFAREAMASAKLDHPHVASALDYGTLSEGGAYLVMQYVRGRSLRKAIDSGEGGWHYACEIGAQIADALAAAHAHRIVHRDLKPENVILEPREGAGELVKVLDFGVARVASEETAGTPGKALTRVGTVIGTPGYMAPEQALGESVDGRADVYALGVVLWEIITRKPLFPDRDLTAIVTAQLTIAAPRLASVATDIPPELDDLVARMLGRTREERPEKVGEVRDALKRLALGATLERKMLSGEISVRSDATSPGHAATMHAAPDRPPARPSVALPTMLTERVDVGPVRGVPAGLLLVGGGALTVATVVFLAAASFSLGGSEPQGPVVPPPIVAPTHPEARGVDPAPVPTASGMTPEAARSTPIPSSMADDVAALLEAERREDRQDAAVRILALPSQDEVPLFVRWVVELEVADRCNERREAVRRLGELADPRSLPALDRIDENRRGCGFLGSQDCNRCLRRDLRTTLEAIRGPEPD